MTRKQFEAAVEEVIAASNAMTLAQRDNQERALRQLNERDNLNMEDGR
jgi:hypothetical protein